MSSDKAPLIDPNQQYPPLNTGDIPGPSVSAPPQYAQAKPHHYPQPHQYPHAPHMPPPDAWSQQPVTSQPHVQHGPSHIPIRIPKSWGTGLCDCCKKPEACLLGCFCPCIFGGRIAKRLGGSFLYGCCCTGHLEMIARPYVRARHNIAGGFCSDCLVTTFCGRCSMCQIDRELDRLGYH